MVEVSNEFTEFVEKNMENDTDKLILSCTGKCNFDLRLAVNTIEGRRKMLKKVPEWGTNRDLVYPFLVSAEQCSSWQTAMFKQRFLKDSDLVFDLTGGLGVDSYYFSKVCKKVIMFEKTESLCSAAVHNFRALGVSNISVYNKEITPLNIEDLLKENLSSHITKNEIFTYIDPSRREKSGKRIFSVKDYEPDIFTLKDVILKYSGKLLIKISPMEDVTQSLKLFEDCQELHIISVHNECKEILLFIEPNKITCSWENIPIEAWNLKKNGEWESSRWTINEELKTNVLYSEPVQGKFLYEPNSSLVKGGAFKIISQRFSLGKADKSSHLYFSDDLIDNFPGRVYNIENVFDFSKSLFSQIREQYRKASVSVRNFPISADELKKKMKIEEGEEFHIFGTTLPLNRKKLIVCKKI